MKNLNEWQYINLCTFLRHIKSLDINRDTAISLLFNHITTLSDIEKDTFTKQYELLYNGTKEGECVYCGMHRGARIVNGRIHCEACREAKE